MITIVSAQTYTMNKGAEFVHELTYSEGYKFRSVESKGQIIRCEAMLQGKWIMNQKPYVVKKSVKRNAEKIKQAVIDYLKE